MKMMVKAGVFEINLGRIERHKKLGAFIQVLIILCFSPTSICVSIVKFLLRKKDDRMSRLRQTNE
ncbi:unnamed protein product [marine sediment metagenome]|uniref:Uncharacterized protein n=1 Tax=marine sediment metagenome TaxID=412755 RepID=X1FBQ1_9ZZZZ